MDASQSRWRDAAQRAAWCAALALAACGADQTVADKDAAAGGGDAVADATLAADPLVGIWHFSGMVPAILHATFTINADKTFTIVETVAPPTLPAGVTPGTCVTTDSVYGTYSETVSGTTNTVTWTMLGGIANAVSGCASPATDTPGVAMTAAAIQAYTDQGLLPPAVETYTVDASTLTLTMPGNGRSMVYTK